MTPRRTQAGQALPLMAIIAPVIILLLFTAIEAGNRMLQRSGVEDALQQATRSSVQSFLYEQFAANTRSLRTEAEVKALATSLFETNLQYIDGLTKSPRDVAAMVEWIILPQGGSCTVAGQQYTFGNQPAICATLKVPMEGLTGKGEWTPRIIAVETVDAVN